MLSVIVERKISTQKGKYKLLPDKRICRNGQLVRDDDNIIFLAMTSPSKQRSIDWVLEYVKKITVLGTDRRKKGNKLEYCYWWMESWLLESWRHYVCFIYLSIFHYLFVNFTSRFAALYSVSDVQANVICPWENFQQSADRNILLIKWHIEETTKSGQSRDTGNFNHKT